MRYTNLHFTLLTAKTSGYFGLTNDYSITCTRLGLLLGDIVWQAISPTDIVINMLPFRDLSVCLSVCLSHSCIMLKRLKTSSRFLLHTVAPRLSQIHCGVKIWLISVNPFRPIRPQFAYVSDAQINPGGEPLWGKILEGRGQGCF